MNPKRYFYIYCMILTFLTFNKIEYKTLTLGEVLDGDRIAKSMFEINFLGMKFVNNVNDVLFTKDFFQKMLRTRSFVTMSFLKMK